MLVRDVDGDPGGSAAATTLRGTLGRRSLGALVGGVLTVTGRTKVVTVPIDLAEGGTGTTDPARLTFVGSYCAQTP